MCETSSSGSINDGNTFLQTHCIPTHLFRSDVKLVARFSIDGNVPGLSSGCIPLGSPLRWDLDRVQAQQLWTLETPIVAERLSWAEAHGASSLWGVVTSLRSQLGSQLGSQAQQEQQKYQICALEASLRLLQGGPERRARLPERPLEGLRRELQGLGSQVQERARAQIQTGPQKCKATSGLHRELRNEEQLPWEEPEMLREEQKLLQGQLSRHPVLLLKPKTEGRHSGRSWRTSVHILQSKLPAAAIFAISFRLQAQSLERDDPFFKGPKMLLSDLEGLVRVVG
ncbi:hypothetical protein EI555_015274 [Monodon monoceros]|uniref:Uncharacterized protein n=1 Tax=Monodon monoceros TaxID=40151 RepID=A0A4U1FBG7_MONMO|nr:hypothetical protein EI555_015274 [Monodon monoceros]